MMSERVGIAVGEALGPVLEVDEDWGRFMRIRVALRLSQSLIEKTMVTTPDGELEAKFYYENSPDYCWTCGLVDHLDGECPVAVDMRKNNGFAVKKFSRSLKVEMATFRYGRSSGEDSRQRSGLGNSVSPVQRPRVAASGVRGNGSQSVPAPLTVESGHQPLLLPHFVEGSGESCSPGGRAVAGGPSKVQPVLGRSIPGIGPVHVGSNLGYGSGLHPSRQSVSHNGQARKIRRWKKAARVSQNYSFDFLGPLSNYQVGQKRASHRSMLIADQPGAMKRSNERGHGCMEAANVFLEKTPAGIEANIGVPGGSLCY
ncbi:Zinc knuckle CX2CX4HX4C [Corchorus olitorius]|uniref:Zinc knuckle CX2CX4HX4C n=1 Tax=Corchorus olitorius TaxID=93759 RepID=A0A1R3IDM1_9ROSI|nr:Zinc knuckle CX2CX4HX4C [Corchorus olitorius]